MGFPEAIAKAQRASVTKRVKDLRAETRSLEDELGGAKPHLIAMDGAQFSALQRALAIAHDALEQAHTIATRET
jgi:hypothetical protein